ncbi:MAG TPA: patatin-like phospholipase family protein [Xanthomonadales bacterium]|nr:patatin-like phospholipase family protein [Xanthomonadales bacterium]
MANNFPKIGLALGSGGAKGLAHIGVLKTLEKAGIDIDFIAGSSIGSLIGAYYAANPSLDQLEELVLSFNRRKGFKLFDPAFRGGLLKGNKIENFISELLDGASFETLRIPYAAIATDMKSAEEVIITDGNLAKAIRASISVPAIFQTTTYKKRLLADGGLSEPVPVDAVRKMGADIVLAVNVESGYFYEPVEKIPQLAGIPMHSVNILRHNLTYHSLKTADVIISPDTPNTGLVGWNYFFNNQKAQAMINAGEEAARKALPEIERLIAERQRGQRPSRLKRFFSIFKRPGFFSN